MKLEPEKGGLRGAEIFANLLLAHSHLLVTLP